MKSDSTTVIKNMEFLVKELHKEWDLSLIHIFDNKIIHKFCYEVNGYTISVSRINTTIHMYLTVRSGTSPLGDVPGGLSQIRKRG